MTKHEQERNINRVLLTMAIAFVGLICMYYLYALVRNQNAAPVFYTLGGLFVVGALVMAYVSSKRSKDHGFGFVEGYKKNLKARLFANFGIFFVVCAILNVVCALSTNLKTTMIVIAWAIAVYTVAMIIGTSIYQAMMEKKEKKQRISAKAAKKAAKKKLRNS